MSQWWSVEVHDAETSAREWRDAYGEALIRLAVEHGALDWSWHEAPWGLVFEVLFDENPTAVGVGWDSFRAHAGVRAALDAVPDPVRGLFTYPGRGGAAGAREPRRPVPAAGSGAVELPEPEAVVVARAVSSLMTPSASDG